MQDVTRWDREGDAMRLRNVLGTSLLTLGAVILGCTGGADTAISGFGNGNNIIGASGVLELTAREFATLDAIPEVTDEELRKVFGSIRTRAVEGNPDAVLLLVRVAALQRSGD